MFIGHRFSAITDRIERRGAPPTRAGTALAGLPAGEHLLESSNDVGVHPPAKVYWMPSGPVMRWSAITHPLR